MITEQKPNLTLITAKTRFNNDNKAKSNLTVITEQKPNLTVIREQKPNLTASTAIVIP